LRNRASNAISRSVNDLAFSRAGFSGAEWHAVDDALESRQASMNPWPGLVVSREGAGRERHRAMSRNSQRSSERDRLDREVAAADALELARRMVPGPERNEALKLAGALRRSADERGPVFAKRGRPRK
jgi:hypothetical protein